MRNGTIAYDAWDATQLNRRESILTLSNTYMGLRGTEDEQPPGSLPGLYVAGLFDKSECLVGEIVNMPDAVRMVASVDGEALTPDACAIESYARELDMARDAGFGAGCLWPWQSDDAGEEEIRNTVHDDGVVERRDILDQYHITSDVAYACLQYLHHTGDEQCFRTRLTPVVVEALRFWRSFLLSANDPNAAVLHIRRVMGPDEYHTCVDDNYYTNWLTKRVFREFDAYLAACDRKAADDFSRINALSPREADELRDIGARIYLGGPRDGVFEQFDGYFRLRDVTVKGCNARGLPRYPRSARRRGPTRLRAPGCAAA